MKPTVGRIVHYVAYGTPKGEHPAGICRAAIVAGLAWEPGMPDNSEGADLVILNPSGLFFDTCRHDEAKAPGTWHWPEREDG
jgi:hypothetical protein